MSQDQKRDEDSQNPSNVKIQEDNAAIIMDNQSYAEVFIQFRESDQMTDETTMEDFLDHANVPLEFRSDFMVAAMLKQVQDLDIASGVLKIEDSYRATREPEAPTEEVAPVTPAEEVAANDLEDIKAEIEEDQLPEIPVIPLEDTPEKVLQGREEISQVEENYRQAKEDFINGPDAPGGKMPFWKGMFNLLMDGSWNPDRVQREKMFVEHPITLDALRLLKYKDMVIDVLNVSAIFYREQDSKLVIVLTGRANITRDVELVVYHDLVAKFLAVISVMNKILGDKYQISNYIIHDKCVIKRNRLLSAEFKRDRGLAIIELKGGAHVNVRVTRKRYNELQNIILEGHYDV